jgi:DNA-binding transcriptional ArsR family regulator
MTNEGAILEALADPTRRRVFELITVQPLSVGELASTLPVSRPAVSQHLRVLKEAGLVTDHAEGTRRIYAPSPAGLDELRAYLDTFWQRSLVAFEAAAKEKR